VPGRPVIPAIANIRVPPVVTKGLSVCGQRPCGLGQGERSGNGQRSVADSHLVLGEAVRVRVGRRLPRDRRLGGIGSYELESGQLATGYYRHHERQVAALEAHGDRDDTMCASLVG